MRVEGYIFLNPNIKKHTSVLVLIMVCVVKDTVCTYEIKRVIERVKEFGIQEMWDKKSNVHVELTVCRYIMFPEMVLEESLHVYM